MIRAFLSTMEGSDPGGMASRQRPPPPPPDSPLSRGIPTPPLPGHESTELTLSKKTGGEEGQGDEGADGEEFSLPRPRRSKKRSRSALDLGVMGGGGGE
jgi:hypothetical protein